MKFFTRDKHSSGLYFAEWEKGYLQFWSEWAQIFNPKGYNWITFTLFVFEIDYDKMMHENLGIDIGLLGFRLRFHQLVRKNKKGEEIEKRTLEMEKKIKKKKKK